MHPIDIVASIVTVMKSELSDFIAFDIVTYDPCACSVVSRRHVNELVQMLVANAYFHL